MTDEELDEIALKYDIDVFRSHGAETVHRLLLEIRRLRGVLGDVRLNVARGPVWVMDRVEKALADEAQA